MFKALARRVLRGGGVQGLVLIIGFWGCSCVADGTLIVGIRVKGLEAIPEP